MSVNRRRIAATAPYDRWVLLGRRLERRRRTLGHTWRTTFQRDRGINTRLAAEVEKAAKDRVDHFMPGTLELVAEGYAVTYESILALLRGETDDLVPAPLIPVPPAPDDDRPPPLEPALIPAARRYYEQIQGRLGLLRARGIPDPSGRQLFPDAPDDAKAWDGVGQRLDFDDRVWLIADLRRRAATRDGGSSTGTAGMLDRGYVAGRGG